MHTKIYSATTIGVQAHAVEVEVDLSYGLLQFNIVGLPDAAIKESRQRITTALKNSGIKLPERKITVNLAPADLKKEGTLFDLPIALGILHAARLVDCPQQLLDDSLCIGELSLDGSIKPVRGVLPIACDAQRLGKKRIIVPKANVKEASLVKGLEVIGVSSISQLVGYLRGEERIEPACCALDELNQKARVFPVDFEQVTGQYQAKRALQIAAAGRHNILFIGSPGSGKTMLAQRLPSIMPPLSFDEIIQVSKVYSVSGKLNCTSLVTQRPFRSPHHTISQAGLVGGGSFPQPGEISLAHHGILFLDELTEFKRTTLEVLRQPLENKKVSIARAQHTVEFPAAFLLVAALNPCPCGFYGDPRRTCSCSGQQIAKYLDKLSGPLLDRIDLQVTVPAVDYKTVVQKKKQLSSQELYVGVERAVQAQKKRFGSDVQSNAYMSSDQVQQFCVVTQEAQELIKNVFEKMHMSMRGYHKVLKVARTIADIDGADIIDRKHVQEAIMYRSLDQSFDRSRN